METTSEMIAAMEKLVERLVSSESDEQSKLIVARHSSIVLEILSLNGLFGIRASDGESGYTNLSSDCREMIPQVSNSLIDVREVLLNLGHSTSRLVWWSQYEGILHSISENICVLHAFSLGSLRLLVEESSDMDEIDRTAIISLMRHERFKWLITDLFCPDSREQLSDMHARASEFIGLITRNILEGQQEYLEEQIQAQKLE